MAKRHCCFGWTLVKNEDQKMVVEGVHRNAVMGLKKSESENGSNEMNKPYQLH